MSTLLPRLLERKAVFISHANPEDNAFATWLTLRLAREGYEVWSDVVKLFGGDDFWRDIESAIRLRTRKFIFVTSRASNQKQGTLQELAVAAGVARQLNDTGFIIPVKTDDLPYADHNIQINRLIAIDFNKEWAQGLAGVLKALEEDSVPRSSDSGPSLVSSWWNTHKLNHQIVKQRPETLWTNWFPITGLPKNLWVWNLKDGIEPPQDLQFPTYRIKNKLISFASEEELTGEGSSKISADGIVKMKYVLNAEPPRKSGLEKFQVTTAVKQLLKDSWHNKICNLGLPLFDLASRKRTLWFPTGSVDGDTVSFDGVNDKKSRRDLYGYLTMTKVNGEKYKRHWHFGVEVVPLLYPTPVFVMKSHVVFTLDGKQVLGDAKTQHRSRRSQCKGWWNDKWRDLTLAAITWLSKGENSIGIKMNSTETTSISNQPITQMANVGYQDDEVRLSEEESTIEHAEMEDFNE